MARDWRLWATGTVTTDVEIQEHGISIMGYVDDNSPCREGDIALGLDLPTDVVCRIVAELLSIQAIFLKPCLDGNQWLWGYAQARDVILGQRIAARNWINGNDGKTISEMATALGIHPSLAIVLANHLRSTGGAHPTDI